jgi:preprotein translocase subunit YajC
MREQLSYVEDDARLASGPAARPKRRRGVRVTSAAVIALGLSLAGGTVAGAASASPGTSSPSSTASGSPTGRPPMGGSPPAAFGTVKSVGDGTFTVTELDGTVVTVNVGSTTAYLDPGVTSPSLADVTVGAHVAVFGTDTSDVIAATRVAIGMPPAGGKGGPGGPGGLGGPPGMGGSPPAAFGTVKSVGDNTFTLTEQDGTVVTVNVGSTTAYVDPGVTSPSLANVTVGEHVAVFGTDSSDVVTATMVALGTPPTGGPGGAGGPGGKGGPPGLGGTPPAASSSASS